MQRQTQPAFSAVEAISAGGDSFCPEASWRRSSWRLLLLVALTATLIGTGCRRRPAALVTQQVAQTMGCSARALTAVETAPTQWLVTGCGAQAAFTCVRSGRALGCTSNAGAPPPTSGNERVAGAPSLQGRRSWTPDLGETLFAPLSPAVLACSPYPIQVRVVVQVDGRVAGVTGHEALGVPAQQCIGAALAPVSVPGGLTQAVEVPVTFR